MNRSLPALILLLGTLGGSIVALGVARDLERANRRSTVHAETAKSGTFGHGRTIPNVTIRTQWLLPAEPTVAPLLHQDEVDYVTTAIEALENDWLQQAEEIVRRSTEELRRRAALAAAEAKAKEIAAAKNHSVVVKRPSYRVPQGHVAVGPNRELVAIEYRGDSFTGAFLWTGALHYGGYSRETIGSTVVNTTPVSQAALPLPWDKLVLWSSDRLAWKKRCQSWTTNLLNSSVATMELGSYAADGVQWIDRQLGRSWDRMANQVRRELWLVTVPSLAVPVRSAELPQGEKR